AQRAVVGCLHWQGDPALHPSELTANPAPGLLVSVRDEDEARIVLEAMLDHLASADNPQRPFVLDVKDPGRGPLGAASPEVLRSIAALQRAWMQPKRTSETNTPPRIEISAALGELRDWSDASDFHAALMHALAGFGFAKAGNSGIGDRQTLQQSWQGLRDALPPTTELVAVAYADHVAADSLSVEQTIESAGNCQFKTLLIDTFDKMGPGTISLLGRRRMRVIQSLCDASNLRLVLAGKVKQTELASPSFSRAWMIGVRGAACGDQDRRKEIDRERLCGLIQTLVQT
ncbi:MAG: (5-formylfuran-3-yl)methyl phosphate synthase, partial [Planctomycetota bacterium]